MMRRTTLLIVAWTLVAAPLLGAVQQMSTSLEISAPRLAAGDLNGDGVEELISAGRVGPFLAVTDPVSHRRAAVAVQSLTHLSYGVTRTETIATYDRLHVVEDVAVGDLDGDGRDEIVVIGDGRITVLTLDDGQLELKAEYEPAIGRLWRVDVTDLDGDGRDELALAATQVAVVEGERSASTVNIYDVDSQLSQRSSLTVDAHIGDICFGDFDGDGKPQLALELGREEFGGIIRLYEFAGGTAFEQLTQQLTPERERVLGLAAVPVAGRDDLALAAVRGQMIVARQSGTHMQLMGRQSMPTDSLPLRSVVSMRPIDAGQETPLLTTGGHTAGLWRVTGTGGSFPLFR